MAKARKQDKRHKFNQSRKLRRELIDDILADEIYEEKLKKYYAERPVKKLINVQYKLFWGIFGLALTFVFLMPFVTWIYLYFSPCYLPVTPELSTNYYTMNATLALSERPLYEGFVWMNKPVLGLGELKDINAESIYSYSPELSKTFARKNIDKRRQIASLTKLMTTKITLEVFDNDSEICVLEKSPTYGTVDLILNNCFKRDQTATFLLVSSSNDAAAQLFLNAQENNIDFISAMNLQAQIYNLNNTNFSNVIGLDSSDNYSTARDIAAMFYGVIQDPLIYDSIQVRAGTLSALNTEDKYKYSNTNILLNTRNDIVGGKTGYTKEAGGTLVVLSAKEDWDFTIITVLLGSDNSDDRFVQMEKLLDLIYQKYGI